MFSAVVIKDSISPAGVRLVTVELAYPRFIHSELMTHRMFSRNAMSSRAVPVAKMIEQVRDRAAKPIHWGANQPGMQAKAELEGEKLYVAQTLWQLAALQMADIAEEMNHIGLHKQVANRVLEPFQWMHTIVTATEWDNFFNLRRHPDAQPEFQHLANLMWEAFGDSEPTLLQPGEWHLPYVSNEEYVALPNEMLKKISSARCARVSYLTHDGQAPEVYKDIELYEKLVGAEPLHASPIEHVATPLKNPDEWSGNFRGWYQYRKEVESSFAV
jgi:hypothetical protein